MDVSESRAGRRFVVDQPITGTFGSASITVKNLSERGVQVEHAEPLRVATKSRMVLTGLAAHTIQLRGIVIWSKLSAMPNKAGKYLYRSGIRVEEENLLSELISQLTARSMIHEDADSMERKRELAIEKERNRTQPQVRPLMKKEELTADQLMLIHHARERLFAHPEEAIKWHDRGKGSLTPEQSRALDETGIRHREDAIAVWEYLERTIDLLAIARAMMSK